MTEEACKEACLGRSNCLALTYKDNGEQCWARTELKDVKAQGGFMKNIASTRMIREDGAVTVGGLNALQNILRK